MVFVILQKLDYQWYLTGTIEAECEVYSLSWNQDGKFDNVFYYVCSSSLCSRPIGVGIIV